MSLRTWENEFYRKPPKCKMTRLEAIEHSLMKWIGLSAENLAKHGVVFRKSFGMLVVADNSDYLKINDWSCALCVKYLNYASWKPDCKLCPLYAHLGDTRCDTQGEPYSIAAEERNPTPMIEALAEVLDKELKENE